MNIDHFKPATVYTIYIAATPERVWEALTSAEFSRKYFFGNAVEVDLKIGGAYIVRTPDGALHISGEVLECDPPRKLTITYTVRKLGRCWSKSSDLRTPGYELDALDAEISSAERRDR